MLSLRPYSPQWPIIRTFARRSCPGTTVSTRCCRGQGQGTVATWRLQATKSRVRDVQVNVDVAGHTVIEKDANSSMVTNWTVAPPDPAAVSP